ncbi:LPD29 domain-containing protein [Streptomyces sp. NPDC059063]|uniref:LPD29 domain-containing protein n=1 Tax=Streptomyces sp. NPDC059063 TaxID=3346712 RepID=UPI0036C3EFB2
MTTYINTRHVSAALKRQLTDLFPGIAFKVGKGTGTGSAWISVSYEDGPAESAVSEIASRYEGSRWSGVDEMYEQTGRTITVVIDGKEVTGTPLCDGVHVHHSISDDAAQEARSLWSQANDGADPEEAGWTGNLVIKGQVIAEHWAANQVAVIARKVVLTERWRLAQEARREAARAADTTTSPEPAQELTLTHSAEDGITVTGTRPGDGSRDALKAGQFRWYRPGQYWYLPATRGEDGAETLPRIARALRAAGLTLSAPQLDGGDEAPVTAPATEQPAPQRPSTYRQVPVPEHLADAWDTVSAADWRDGVDAALTFAALTNPSA